MPSMKINFVLMACVLGWSLAAAQAAPGADAGAAAPVEVQPSFAEKIAAQQAIIETKRQELLQANQDLENRRTEIQRADEECATLTREIAELQGQINEKRATIEAKLGQDPAYAASQQQMKDALDALKQAQSELSALAREQRDVAVATPITKDEVLP